MTFDNKLSKIVSSLRSNHKAIWNIWESSKWTFFVFIVLTILLHPQIVYIACIRKEVCLSPYTDDPPLSSHPQGNSKSLLDEGWLLNRVHQKLALYLAENHFILKQTPSGACITFTQETALMLQRSKLFSKCCDEVLPA